MFKNFYAALVHAFTFKLWETPHSYDGYDLLTKDHISLGDGRISFPNDTNDHLEGDEVMKLKFCLKTPTK